MSITSKVLLGAVALVLVASAVDAAPVARMRSCDDESDLMSARTRQATTVWFRNEAGRTRKLYWLDFNGDRKFYAVIEPGQQVEQQTYGGHPWVVTDRRDRCVSIYVPSGRSGVVNIN